MFQRFKRINLGNKHSRCICGGGPARLGDQAMKHDELWFAVPLAWALVFFGAAVLASFG